MELKPLPTLYTFAGFSFPRYVVQLPKGSLEARKAAKRFPRCCGPYQTNPGTTPAQQMSFYHTSDFAPDLRMRYADEVISLRHSGWFYNEFGDTMRGLVARLPHGRGFLAGWTMGENMASGLDRATIYDNEEDAARAADSEAEIAAETQRNWEIAENDSLAAAEADAEDFNETGEI